MTAATQDRNYTSRKGEKVQLPVAADAVIYAGTAVCSNASGYAVPGANTAGLKFEGIAEEGVDNTGGANAAVNVSVQRDGVQSMVAAGLTAADIGKDLYLADDQTVQLARGNVYAGILSRFTTATEAEVAIAPAVKGSRSPRGRTFTITAVGAGAIGNTLKTLIANLEAGGAIEVLAAFVTALTAAGAAASGYSCAVILTDGTTAITLTLLEDATAVEDKAINQAYPAGANLSVTMQDNNVSAATADVTAVFVCREL